MRAFSAAWAVVRMFEGIYSGKFRWVLYPDLNWERIVLVFLGRIRSVELTWGAGTPRTLLTSCCWIVLLTDSVWMDLIPSL